MRFVKSVMVAGVLVIATGALDGAQSGDPKASAVIAAARKALGGEQKLASLEGLSLRASYTRESGAPTGGGGSMTIMMMGPGPAGGGPPQGTGDLEIDVELPDKYIKVDTGTGMMAMTRTEGFDGDRPFVDVASTQPGLRVMVDRSDGDPAAQQAALRRSRQDLARLLLGVIAGTQRSFAVTYAYAGQAESPDGKADVIDVTGPDGFAARLFIDPASHLPMMLTYMAPEPRMIVSTGPGGRGGPGRAGGAGGGDVRFGPAPQGREDLPPAERERMQQAMKDAEATPARMIEYRLFFNDFRAVDGLRLPFQIGRGTAGKTTEEWVVKSYKVNPVLKADRFNVGKPRS